ncbi:MAG: recombinase family protein, partial [Candidatus Moraniibacteriota bacterium]
ASFLPSSPTSFNKHRKNSEFKIGEERESARSAVCSEFPPRNPQSERMRHAERGSSFANALMNDHTRKFFIYTRKSTDTEDRQVRSISDQLAELKELAVKEQIEVVDIFVEKQTAKVPGRPVFNEMLLRIEQNEASGILAWHPDRLARNSVDGGKIIYLLDTGKITELKFPTFWCDPTPQGKFMLSIAFSQSK